MRSPLLFILHNGLCYVAACKKDNLAPAYKTIQLAKKAANMKYKEYDCGHFNIYLSPFFEEVIED